MLPDGIPDFLTEQNPQKEFSIYLNLFIMIQKFDMNLLKEKKNLLAGSTIPALRRLKQQDCRFKISSKHWDAILVEKNYLQGNKFQFLSFNSKKLIRVSEIQKQSEIQK